MTAASMAAAPAPPRLALRHVAAVSAGNAAAVGVIDYLEYYADDPYTNVALVYVEGLVDGRDFATRLRAVTERIPIVLVAGSYVGTIRGTGLTWVLPLTTRRSVSVRVRNFETGQLKVNDADGNPVQIAAIVVWQVADTAKSTYAVEYYLNFVTVQAESPLVQTQSGGPLAFTGQDDYPADLFLDAVRIAPH